VVNGEVVIGANFFPTEIGHMSLDPDGRQCGCGLRGCPEMYISGKGVHAGVEAHRVAYPNTTLPEAPTTGDILAAARAGDPLAVAVMEEAARWLGAILACCAGILNPALFVIGGGLGEAAGDLLIPGAERELRRRTLPNTHDRLRLIPSQVKSTAVGAACLVWHGLSRGEHMR
jgi:glucokinase